MSTVWLVERFCDHLRSAIEMMAGEKPRLSVLPPAPPPPEFTVLEQPFSIDGAMIWLAGEPESWIYPGTVLLKAAGIDDADEETSRSTFRETLTQAFSALASDLTGRLKAEVTAGAAAEVAVHPTPPSWTALDLDVDGTRTLRFHFAPGSALLQVLDRPQLETPSPSRELEAPRGPIPGIEGSRTLELLLDVELPVSVSFGRAQLPLKDVIKLTTGSIVELNRTVGEPVEVLVNNCVIARGEVVVVEGNFGVRVQQVISRQERLRTLY